jgi:16S rRNA (guanine527-N7)-methyltransferase
MSFPDLLRRNSPISLSDTQLDALNRHYELLLRWNSVMNLTAIRDIEEIVLRHYCESLFLAQYLPEQSISIADIGSGPGFPGFPVAVARPDCSITLIESHRRTGVFLKETSRGIPNIFVLTERAKDVKRTFDWVIARAVRIQDVLGSGLARNYAVLVGGEQEGISLPWGKNRRLLIRST